MKKSFLFISCEEAHHICDKSQYGEATLWEKIKLNIRLSWCKISQAYTKKNKALTKAIKRADIHALQDHEKIELRQYVEKHLSNKHH